MKPIKDTKEVAYKIAPEVKFLKYQTSDLAKAKRMIEGDFAGGGYDPEFDTGIDSFEIYLNDFTGTKMSDFSQDQINVIMKIYKL